MSTQTNNKTMITIKDPQTTLLREQYESPNGVTYTCIGYGENPSTGALYVIGSVWDQTSNRTTISTHLLKEVKFIGKV